MHRLLLLIAHRKNSHLLAELLSPHYEIARPPVEGVPTQAFDLAIVDGPAIHQYSEWLRTVKRELHPVFLPVLLVSRRQDIGLATSHLWESIDDLLISPIEKAELQARVASLLQTRRLSLENALLAAQLRRELARARQVQADLLPRVAPVLPGFELAACCLPALEVGGDFYDWQEPAPQTLCLRVGDVMGKGMSAALVMATIRAALRATAQRNGPAEALDLVRQTLQPDLERAGSFMTLFQARLEAPTRRLRYVDAGHSHAFVLRNDGRVESLVSGGRPLGFPVDEPYREGELWFEAGDSLVVYSDGLVEKPYAADLEPSELAGQLQGATSATEMVERLIGPASRNGPPPDDLTVVILHCRGELELAAARAEEGRLLNPTEP